MAFDCYKLKSTCKAACCGPTPMPAELWKRLKHKAIRPIEEECYFDGPHMTDKSLKDPMSVEMMPYVVPIGQFDEESKSHRCPFLTYDLKCNIYDERPFVCREFGKESHVMMKCCFQDKDGRVRSRQERRGVDREQNKSGGEISNRLAQDAEGKLIQLQTKT